jgi:CBS domain-containing protein
MPRSAAIRAVPVVDDDRTLKGVVSEADLMAAVGHAEGDARRWGRPRHIHHRSPQAKPGATTAAELMTTDVETVTPTTRLPAAARTMMDSGLSWMPVCDQAGRVVGVLARSDVLTVFLRDDASIQAEILDDILRYACSPIPPPCRSTSQTEWSP